MSRKNWTRLELLAAFNLYCHTPFGRLHRNNTDIIRLAQSIGRTPSALAMKLVNFAAFDPVQQARGIRGLGNTSRADGEIWREFNDNPETIAIQSQIAIEQFLESPQKSEDSNMREDASDLLPMGPTEVIRSVKVRLVQSFFRDAVLTSYDFRCAVCNLNIIEMLNASHIIPWRQNVERRADPRNGLSLCVLHDRAFDRGLFTLNNQFQVVLSQQLKNLSENHMQTVAFTEMEGQIIKMPQRFSPDPAALLFHREHIFQN
ncbi:HNH endonuclease [bacterium]|nr:MAG: HNH endonuclease [bacterium]